MTTATTAQKAESPSIGSDLIWGAEEIGREIGRPTKKVFYLLERGYIPAKKIGGLWVASRATLREYLCTVE
jgi:hypothetical protein